MAFYLFSYPYATDTHPLTIRFILSNFLTVNFRFRKFFIAAICRLTLLHTYHISIFHFVIPSFLLP
ncbi:hypothetical protein CW304_11830 [Bacillus sp. UFRGS-B20]|nr:hypothetical protein CW304_11830 [Bacillus sp. UFRGS-B20]